MSAPQARSYQVAARSSGTFGRVLASARNHHFVVDGPVQNGCPGEALSPPELFLAGVATCGVELVEVLAQADGVTLRSVSVAIDGVIDRERQPRPGVTLFNSVRLRFRLEGVGPEAAGGLIEKFKAR